jgi:hypothetical protein
MNKLTRIDWKLVRIPVLLVCIMDVAVIALGMMLFPGNKKAWISMELLLPFGAVWPGIFYLGEIWQHSTWTELLLSCNQKLNRMMLEKYLRWLLIFSLCQEIVAALICLPTDLENGYVFLTLLLAECFAFGGIGFIFAVLFRNPEWSITMILCIMVADYGSQGALFGKLHFALYWYDGLSFGVVGSRIVTAVGIGLLSFVVAGWANKNRRTRA